MRAIAFAAVLTVGCGLFAKGSAFPSDLQKIEDCVATQVITNGNTDVGSNVLTCGPSEIQTVLDTIRILLGSSSLSSATKQSLGHNLTSYSASHGAR